MENFTDNYKDMRHKIYEKCKNNDKRVEIFEKTEHELAYYILKKRFENLLSFLDNLEKKYNLSDEDKSELLELWFLHNDLKEIHFIGTDLYSDVMFIKHEVPYLYRSVGRDNTDSQINSDFGNFDSQKKETVDAKDIGETIIQECLEQIKSGGKGKLFSYSKCFGKMLFKYCNILKENTTTLIEIRENVLVNCVCENGNLRKFESLQRFVHDMKKHPVDAQIVMPFFNIDMSNARKNSVENLKLWLNDYLGEQEYKKRFNDIHDPIGDAEVVSNYTGENRLMCDRSNRVELEIDPFCKLLYIYGLKISKELGNVDKFKDYITASINSIPHENGVIEKMYYNQYKSYVYDDEDPDIDLDPQIDKLIRAINWDKEKEYMQRQKLEKGKNEEKVAQIDVFKQETSEHISGIWKDIVKEAIRGEYTFTNFSPQSSN